MKKTHLLCILDGWGYSSEPKNNAIYSAKTPNWDRILGENPNSLLETSGLAVGLPEGQMGNSEVGHMTIGAGRIMMQSLPRIDRAILDGSFENNDILQKTLAELKSTGKTLHIMGLVSDGGVHSHINHIIEIARIAEKNSVNFFIHAFCDGRDTAPDSGINFIKRLKNIATISGRYFAMDRDNRWERVEKAYNVMVLANGEKFTNAENIFTENYKNNIFDEFIAPVVAENYQGMEDGDAIFFANFRADRARQIATALVEENFDGFARKKKINFSNILGMVEYSGNLNKYFKTIFPSEESGTSIGKIISDNNKTQLRIAETEKYAHVTFFFSGGVEEKFPGEERILVPSPKVATYDLQPEMSANEVTTKLVEAINSKKFDFIVVNFANPDMVGHTGVFEAAVKAVEAIDQALLKIETAIKNAGGIMFITADHGNIEEMWDENSNQPHTQHSLNPVYFVGVNLPPNSKLKNGSLADIAPTMLHLMKINIPSDMNGKILID